MQRDAFVPRFAFTRTADDPPPALCSWEMLEAWIPARVAHLCAALPRDVPHLAAVLLDCGDTLIDEATEVKAAGSELVLEAEEIPHAMDAVRRLAAAGYRLALVADGPRLSFENLLKPRGIWELFDAHVISEDVGDLKPSPKMFATALDRLGLGDIERNRVVMVGNNLARDIAGANSFGLTSLYVGWSKQRPDAPADPLEMPDARIDRLDRLPETIAAFELAL
jgi:putative hydrolase of the HAD superfamily